MAGGACTGIHAVRVGGFALADIALTVLLVVVLMYTLIPPSSRTLPVAALVSVASVSVGEVLHVALGVNSTIAAALTGGAPPCTTAN